MSPTPSGSPATGWLRSTTPRRHTPRPTWTPSYPTNERRDPARTPTGPWLSEPHEMVAPHGVRRSDRAQWRLRSRGRHGPHPDGDARCGAHRVGRPAEPLRQFLHDEDLYRRRVGT